MHIHIIGICGTFMASVALLARDLGYKVTGCDANVYPPMSTQLANAGIEIIEGFAVEQLSLAPDLIIIGNAFSRGNPLIEAILAEGIPYTSGAKWVYEAILQHRWTLAVSGTHGKTTTTSMLAWILDYAGLNPGFLIGGIAQNFNRSARIGESPFFIIEADEYDTAFFDKRSKFIHYRPKTLIINNIEYDHADIFPDLAAIQRQFHYLIRTVPNNGLIIYPAMDKAIPPVLAQGCWTPTAAFSIEGSTETQTDWHAKLLREDGSQFQIYRQNKCLGEVSWSLVGNHNVANALAAIIAAKHASVDADIAAAALSEFKGVKRRLEIIGNFQGITLYDDFAHHPTAIATTLTGLRNKVGKEKIIAVIEPRSNTMRLGAHQHQLVPATQMADQVIWYQPPDLSWDLAAIVKKSKIPAKVFNDLNLLIEFVLKQLSDNSHVVFMSNGGFGGVQQKILSRIKDAVVA